MEDPLNAGYGDTISHILLTLKTTKWAPKLLNWIKEHIAVGDVICIESYSGACKRVGKSDTFAKDF